MYPVFAADFHPLIITTHYYQTRIQIPDFLQHLIFLDLLRIQRNIWVVVHLITLITVRRFLTSSLLFFYINFN